MGCGSSKVSADSIDLNNNEDDRADPRDEQIDIEDTETGYPPPKPPRTKKADVFREKDFAKIDKRSKEAPIEITNSWDELIGYLNQGCNTDLQLLRSLFIWLASLNLDAVPVSDDPSSLRSMIWKLKRKQMSYGVFFTLLCRTAKLRCVLIRGHGKSVAYEVGDTIDKVEQLYNIWNAVYVDGDWRLVMPLWACRGVVGHSSGRHILVEAQGQAVRQGGRACSGRVVSHINDYYFLTDPEELVVNLFSKDPQWQLLSVPYTLEKFCDIPQLEENYFRYNLEIKSSFKCRYHATDGKCHLAIQAKGDKWEGVLEYKLYYNKDESVEHIPDELQIDKYVIMERSINQLWKFIVRFPVAGVYKMEIYGGLNPGNILPICSFKLFCDTAMEHVCPLPIDPGLIGFGPTPKLESVGLTSPSQTKGIILIQRYQDVNFSFVMKRPVSIRSELVHTEKDSQVLQKYINQKIVKKKLQLNVIVREIGEYALRMYAIDKETDTEENVCNYLLSSDDPKKGRENPTERRARENLRKAIVTEKNPDELEKYIEMFENLRMNDMGDLSKAYKRHDFLVLQKDLQDAVNRRHLETLEKAIKQTKESEYEDDLSEEIEKAEHLLEHLRRLKGFCHDILELRQTTVSEIHSYNHAQPIVYHVMKATCLLLGEKEHDVEDWELVKIIIGSISPSLISRINKLNFKRLNPEIVAEAESIIKDYSKETAQTVSAGVGTFYVWCRNVCDEFHRTNS